MANRVTRVTLEAVTSMFNKSVDASKRKLTELKVEAEKFDGSDYSADVNVDDAKAKETLSALQRQLDEYAKKSVTAKASLTDQEAKDRLDALNVRLEKFGEKVSEARVELKDPGVQTKLSSIEAALLRVGAKTAKPEVDLQGIAASEAQLGMLEARLEAYSHKSYNAHVGTTGGRGAMWRDLALTLGPVLIPALGAATVAVGAFGTSLLAAGGAAGVLGISVGAQIVGMKNAQKEINFVAMSLSGLTEGTDAYKAKAEQLANLQAGFAAKYGVAAKAFGDFQVAWGKFQESTSGSTLPLIAQGLGLVESILPHLVDLVDAAAGSVSKLLSSLANFGHSAEAASMLAFFEVQGPKAIEVLGSILGNFGKGLVSLFMAFTPAMDGMVGGLQDISKAFADWAAHLGATEGFQNFLAYIAKTGPHVWDTLGALAQAFISIVQAAAPVGAVTLPIIQALAEVLSFLAKSPAGPALFAIAAALVLVNRALSAGNAIKGSPLGERIQSLTSSGTGLAGIATKANAAKVGLFGLGVGMEVLATKIGSSNQQLSDFFTIVGGASMGAAFGPWGAAFGAAGGLLQVFSQGSQRSAEAQQALDAQVASIVGTLDQETGALTRATTAMAVKTLADSGAYTAGAKLGLSYDTVTKAYLGNADAIAQVQAAYDAALAPIENLNQANAQTTAGVHGMTAGMSEGAGALADFRGEFDPLLSIVNDTSAGIDAGRTSIQQQQAALAAVNPEMHTFTASQAEMNKVMGQLGPSVSGVNVSISRQQATMQAAHADWLNQVTVLDDATSSAEDYKAALDALVNTSGDQLTTQLDINKGWIDFRAAVDAANQAVKGSGTSLSHTTSAGIANITMIKGMIEGYKTQVENFHNMGKSVDFTNHKLQDYRHTLIQNLVQMGFNGKAVTDLINTYGLTPELIRTLFKADTAQAAADVMKFSVYVKGIKPAKVIVAADTKLASEQAHHWRDDINTYFAEKPPVITPKADTAGANKGIADTKRNADDLGKTAPQVDVSANTNNANTDITATQGRADHLAGTRPQVDVSANTSGANSDITATQGRADHLAGTKPRVDVSANTSGANADIANTQRNAEYLDRTSPTVTVEAQTDAAITKIQGAIAQIQHLFGGLGGYTVPVTLSAQTDKVLSQLKLADGAVVDYYAKGGMRRENHIAQIARPGSMRVWAEPETGGEAYIPLSPAKRPRSRSIADETVQRLGGQVQWFAKGGVTGKGGGSIVGHPSINVTGESTGIDTSFNAINSFFKGIVNQVGASISGLITQAANAAMAAQQAAAAAAAASAGNSSAGGSGFGAIKSVASGYGWSSGIEWTDLVKLVNSESGGNPNAQNPTSTAYGMFQFLDGTWASVGGHKTSDPHLQAVYGLKYIQQRYGDPVGAWNFHVAHNWYDNGGVLPPGASMAYNGTGQNETVLPYPPEAIARAMKSSGGGTVYMTDPALASEMRALRLMLDDKGVSVRNTDDIGARSDGIARTVVKEYRAKDARLGLGVV